MAELPIGQLIKLILGILVFAAVIFGVYFIFKDKILEFFNTVPLEMFRSLLR